MTALYLFCLILGGGLLAFTVLGGIGDADADADLDADADVDADADGDWHGLQAFLSVRTLVYFLAGFGATGTLLELFTDASSPAALAWAIVVGIAGAIAAAAVYGYLRASESGAVSRDNDYLVGLPAEVVLPVVPGRRGKVRLLTSGREVQLLARLHGADDPACERGATVVIVDVDGDTALVAPAPALNPDTPEGV